MGLPVLGYDIALEGGRLIVNEDEAAQVRAIYQLYLEHKAMMPVVHELNARGWRAKRWITKKGRERGGRLFTKGSLFRLLTNVIYTGSIEYKGTIYDGEHKAIVDVGIWQQFQDTLQRNGRTGGYEVRNKFGALLKGLIYCTPCGTGMVHTYTSRKRKRYRYYVCLNAQQRGWSSCPSKSLNAQEIEAAVVQHIRGIGNNEKIIAATVAKIRQAGDRRLAGVAQVLGMRPDEVKAYGKSPQTVKARALLCFLAHRKLGMTTVGISSKLRISQSAVSRLSKRGEAIACELSVELIEGKA